MKTNLVLFALLLLTAATPCEGRGIDVSGQILFVDGDPITWCNTGATQAGPVSCSANGDPCIPATPCIANPLSPRPAHLVTVIIRPEGTTAEWRGTTDSDGRFSIPVKVTDTALPRILLEVENHIVRVWADTDAANETLEEALVLEESSITRNTRGDIDIGTVEILVGYRNIRVGEFVNPAALGIPRPGYCRPEMLSPPCWVVDPVITVSFAAALNINDVILRAREDIISNRGEPPDSDTIGQVDVEYCDEGGTPWGNFGTHYLSDLVLLCPLMEGRRPSATNASGMDDGFRDETIAHEYAHHLQYEIGTWDWHGGDHGRCKEIDSPTNDPEFAWSEGFAEFFGRHMVVEPDGITARPLMSTSGVSTVDNECYSPASEQTVFQNASDFDEERWISVESHVAGLLWDLTDPRGTGTDAWDAVNGGTDTYRRIIQIFDRDLDWGAAVFPGFFVDAPDLIDFYWAWFRHVSPSDPELGQPAIDPIINRYGIVPAGGNPNGDLTKMRSLPFLESNPTLPVGYRPAVYTAGSLVPLTVTRDYSYIHSNPSVGNNFDVNIGVSNLGSITMNVVRGVRPGELAFPGALFDTSTSSTATFTASTTQSWLSVTPASGSFTPQHLQTLAISFLPSAFALPPPESTDRERAYTADVNIDFNITTPAGRRSERRTIRIVFNYLGGNEGPNGDIDGDGLTNREEKEILRAQNPARFSCLDPGNWDSDGDGLRDGSEAKGQGRHATSPCSKDTDGDGASDPEEIWCFGRFSAGECQCFNPTVADSNARPDSDPDLDGLTNAEEEMRGTHPCQGDYDGDGVPDGADTCLKIPNPGNSQTADLDQDGIPNACDTDADGDGCERDFDANDLQSSSICQLMTHTGRKGGFFIGEDQRFYQFLDGVRIEGISPCEGSMCPPPSLVTMDRDFHVVRHIPSSQFGLDGESGFGMAVTMLPDIDGDGAEDIAIGAPLAKNSQGVENAGVIVVVSGGTGKLLGKVAGTKKNGRFGSALSRMDSKHLAVGVPGSSSVEVVSFSDFKVLRELTSGETDDKFGAAVVSVGDVDGDGEIDLAIGAPEARGKGGRAGAAFLGSSSGTVRRFGEGEADGDRFGQSLLFANDVDRNRVPDVLVGAPGASHQVGEIALLSLSGNRAWVTSGRTEKEKFGVSLAVAARSRSDGRVIEFLVGAPEASDSGKDRSGRVYVVRSDGSIAGFGGGEQKEERFGSLVAVMSDGSYAVVAPNRMEGERVGSTVVLSRVKSLIQRPSEGMGDPK